MNKYNFLKLCLIFVNCFVLITTCQKVDKVDTNQLGDKEVTLKSFGPCPIARGAELRIIGTRLDKVESVTIPGSGDITSITRISKTEIRMTIPQNAEPGLIALNVGKKVITSITELSFSEPISIEKITPLTAKAGAKIKIEGEYLNLIKEIFFMDGISVRKDDFVSQSRKAIEVILPIKAQTGKVIVSNGADILTEEEIKTEKEPGIPIWVYSEEELVVTLPTLTSFSPSPIRAGSVLTITGKDFDLVEKISFGGDRLAGSFTANGEKTSITVTVPQNAQDGAVVLTAFSGVKVPSATNLVMVIPTISAVSPNPVKNGTVLTVTGTNLDLVDKVFFGGDKQGSIVEGRTATEIKVNVPIDAKDGVTFTTLAAKEVTVNLTMVKPTVTAYNPSPVPGGSAVKIQGADLDLVVSVTFVDDLVVPVEPTAANELTVTVPMTAVSGAVVLTLTNGEKVNAPNMQIDTPLFAIIPKLPDSEEEIHAGELLAVEILNGDKLTDVQINGVSVQFILADPKLYILIPDNADGKTELKLISSNGTAIYTISVIGNSIVETVIWTGPWTLDWGDGPGIPKSLFQDVPAGSILKVYIQVTNPEGAELAINDATWTKIVTGHPDAKPSDAGTIAVAAGIKEVEIVLTEFVLNWMLTTSASWDAVTAIRPVGSGAIISKISIITTRVSEEILFEGNRVLDWSEYRLSSSQFESAKSASVLKFYFSSLGGEPMVKMYDGDWGLLVFDHPEHDGELFRPKSNVLEIPLSGGNLDKLKASGMIYLGEGVTISKITLKL